MMGGPQGFDMLLGHGEWVRSEIATLLEEAQ